MKKTKIITSFIVLMLLVCLAIPGMTTFAKTTDNGLVYSVVNGNSVKITGYIGEETEIVIPSEIDGYPVTSIGGSAFCDYYELTRITLPDTVTSIGDSAFYYCEALESITIPDSVKSIGDYAFSYCKALTSVTFGSSLESICYGAFENSKAITSVTFPNSVKSIDDYAFSGCTALTNVVFEDSAASIGNYAFNNCSALTTVSLGENVTSIGNYAFYTCAKLASITIPDSTESIGSYAFNECTSLTSALIGDSVKTIGSYAFSGCTALANATIGDSVKTIGSYAFNGCSALTRIAMGDSVESIGACAFYGCKSLRSITIPESAKTIGNYAFYGCDALRSIAIPDSVTSMGYQVFSFCDALKSVTIGNSVTSIGERAFYECTSLTSVEIGNSVTSIGEYAFYDCTSLKSIVIPSSVKSIGSDALHQYNGGYSPLRLSVTLYVTSDSYAHTYAKSNGFSYVATEAAPTPAPTPTPSSGVINGFGYNIIENSYAEITSYSGEETEISIPYEINGYAVKSIGNDAFCDCTALTKVIIPNGITNIGDGAFYNCSSLKSIIVPDGVEKIGSYAFYECSALLEITIASSVKSIGDSAFFGCEDLTVYGTNYSYAQSYAEENSIPFADINGNGTISRKSVMYAAYSVERSVKNNSRLPKYVTLEGEKIYMPELFGILAQFIVSADNNFASEALIARNSVTIASTSYEAITGTELTKAQYVELAKKVIAYIGTNSTAPGYVETEAGALSYETMLNLFAQIGSYARSQKKLPETVAVSAWVQPLPTPPVEEEKPDYQYVSFDEILNGAAFANLATRNTGDIPAYVTVADNTVRMYKGTMLSMFTKAIISIEGGKTAALPMEEITVPSKTVAETITNCSLTKAEYLKLAQRIANSIDSTGALPKYCTTSYGTINTSNMIYIFTRVLEEYNTNGALPELIAVQAWGTYEF